MNKLFSWARGSDAAAHRSKKRISLALQGGGAHGAFTWGVIDYLLQDGRIDIDGLSGASAGAINAVMLADGLARGGRDEARKRLADFWRAASVDGSLPVSQRQVFDRMLAANPPMKSWLNSMSRFLGPDVHRLNINPLKRLIERFVDFDAVRASQRDIFIATTNAQTGDLRIFTAPELTAEVVMASAALPPIFRAVEIEGEQYWDGGYTSNPPLLPFQQADGTEDVLLVQIYPVRREETPTTSREVAGRTSEIAFNAPLFAELRALAAIDQVEEKNGGRRLRLHRIALDEGEVATDPASRLNNHFEFFQTLHDLGRRAAQRFLTEHFAAIGTRSTMDAEKEYASG